MYGILALGGDIMRKLRTLVFVMTLTLLITGIPLDAFAKEYDLDGNFHEIKTLFNIGDEYDDFDTHQYNSNGKTITDLSWSSKGKNISVRIDQEGNIVGYWKNLYSTDRKKIVYKFPKITRKEGEKIAKDFIKKLYPDILDEIKSRDEDDVYIQYRRNDLREYSYNFTRVKNDLFFNENYIHVSVDTQTGKVNDFNISWEENLKFADKKDIISKDEAKKIYKDNIDLNLSYKIKETDENLQSYLGYNMIDTDIVVDANTKDILSTSYKSIYPIYGSRFHQNMESISSEEENKLINSKKILTRKEASEKIVDMFKLGKEYKIESHKLIGNKENDIYIWELMVMKYMGDHGSGTGTTIDAKTGEIIDFSDPGSRNMDEKKQKYSKEELLKKANELIKNSSPEKYKEVEYIENENEYPIYDDDNTSNFLFVRTVNGVKVENDGFRIALSNATGNVRSYTHNWSDLEFESPNNVIQKDKAKDILLEDKELVLEYQRENDKREKKDVRLVYDFKDKYFTVDAKKAEVIDNKKETMEKAGLIKYKDIENSFAKNQINKLQDYIVLFKGELFKPKQEITQKEFFQLLTQIKDMYYLYEDQNYMYERFINDGILKKEEKNLESKVTREEAIKYIVRAFGQEPLEDLGDIYKLEYDDIDKISTNLRGHVAIAKGLGIISGKGNFRPKDNLTREEAAALIYNILDR